MSKDYYQILGLQKGAGDEEIRRAFKKLARKFHPDVNPGDKKAEERFKEISEAYQVLSDPEKRKQYDTFGSFEGFPGGGRTYTYAYGADPFGSPFGRGQTKYSSGFDFNDLGDIFGEIFSGGSGGKTRKRTKSFYEAAMPQRGKDLYFSAEIDFMEAVTGGEKKIRLQNGAAYKVKIPAGISERSKIRLPGKGEPGLQGGESGDLYLEINIKPHPFFRRDGDDLTIDVPVTFSEAITGAKIDVPTASGKVMLKIPPGTQSGQKLRLKGKGVINMKTKAPGDMYAVLQIQIPADLDEKTKEEILKLVGKKEKNPREKLYV